MYKGSSSRVIPIVLVVLVMAIAIAVLITVGRAIFGGDQSSQGQTDTGRQALLSTTSGHSVRMTVRGPIVANENFQSYLVLISPESRLLNNYTGYLGQSTSTKQLSNNVKAYEEFVHALDKATLMDGTAFSGDKDDTRGICATGSVYEFDVLTNGSSTKHLWTSTCSGSRGSLKGSLTQDKNLFMKQIPGADMASSQIAF
jgi:hypothetical protein